MSTYVTQAPPHAGAAITFSAPGGTAGDVTPTGAGIGLLVNNAGASTCVVTLPLTPQYDGLAIANRQLSVLPGQIGILPTPDSVYGPGTTPVSYSEVSSVTVASVRIP